MKCHYEVLGVERNASDGDIKKAYRRLALQYHPDKNQDNVEECTRLFTAVQQAYEVLSDPQERAWYDKHREDILYGAGSDFKDESFNLMPYFSATCFTGHGDDKEGFYSVYAEVFQRLIEEEAQYMEDDDERLPLFGDSTSDYETVVHRFYSYWQSFSTHKSFAWEDEHNLRDAPNRRVQRLMEKENRKLREAAKKKTNDTIRALVAFVRKRDKRVQAYKIVLEEREMLRQQKVAEKRAKDREKRLRLQEEYQADPSHSEAVAQFEEELQSLATQLNDEFGRDSSGSEESAEEDLFCPACNKLFKTDKAFANHQRSKKHCENAALLRKLLQEEEAETQLQKSHNDSDQSDHNIWDQLDGLNLTDPQHTNHVTIDNTAPEDLRTDHHNTNSSASTQSRCDPVGMASSSDTDEEPELPVILLQSGAPSASLPEETVQQFSLIKEDVEEAPRTKRKAKGGKKKTVSSCESSGPRSQLNYCHVCNKDFPSRNKLFQHIKDTGHALRIDTEPPKSKKSARRKK